MTQDLEQMMAQDAEALPSGAQLQDIAELAKTQLELEREIAYHEAQLTTLQNQLRQVSESALPAAMLGIGMSEFKLDSGQRITIKNDLFASIRADKIEEAVKWLDENNLGGIVKDEIKVNLGRGEVQLADRFLDLARQLGISAAEKLSVHPGTLKSTVKDMRTKGVEFPPEFFSIADLSKSIIK